MFARGVHIKSRTLPSFPNPRLKDRSSEKLGGLATREPPSHGFPLHDGDLEPRWIWLRRGLRLTLRRCRKHRQWWGLKRASDRPYAGHRAIGDELRNFPPSQHLFPAVNAKAQCTT